MTEEQRLKIVDRINKVLKEKEEYEKMVSELELLEKNETVIRYNKLKNEVNNLSKSFLMVGDKSNIIYTEFFGSINEMKDSYELDDCKHEIYVYSGSFGFTTRKSHEFSISDICNYRCVENEDDPDFAFNKYECLLCGKIVQKSKDDIKQFEKKHIIFRNPLINSYLASTYYKKEFFEFLYKYDIETATEMILSKYYDDLDNALVKKLGKEN